VCGANCTNYNVFLFLGNKNKYIVENGEVGKRTRNDGAQVDHLHRGRRRRHLRTKMKLKSNLSSNYKFSAIFSFPLCLWSIKKIEVHYNMHLERKTSHRPL
jgi:hypothetical protein